MNRARLLMVALALIAGIAALMFFGSRRKAAPTVAGSRRAAPTVAGSRKAAPAVGAPAAAAGPAARRELGPAATALARLAQTIPADSISPIAADLNARGGDIRRDLEILNEVLEAWRTNFPRAGNPTGENDEITLALAGANALHFAFIPPTHPAINARGELCDRWGTPFRFHALSGTQMELRSAGPDRKFATGDDVQFAPWGNSP